MAEPADRTKGVGRIIVMVYAILALAASWSSGFQILTELDHAPVAVLLYPPSGLVCPLGPTRLPLYRVTYGPVTAGPSPLAHCHAAVWFELIGVIVIGIWSLIAPQFFPEPTVWSTFGIGYGFIPLVLPIIGLYWLHRHRPQPIT